MARRREVVRGETLALSKSEVQALQLAMSAKMQAFKNREMAAKCLGLSESAVQKAMRGKVPTYMTRSMLDDVGRVLQLDVRHWGG